jgi:hypothetical protein
MQRAKHYWALALVCLSLSCSAARPTFAADDRLQVIPTTLTVTCQQEQRIAFVSASATAQDKTTVKSLGLAITSTKAPEDRKVFCVYWFTTPRGLVKKRDDDSGKLQPSSAPLFPYSRDAVNRFFQKLDCPPNDNLVNVIIDVIDRADPSVADGVTAQAFVTALNAKGLLKDSSLKVNDQALGSFDNFSNESGVAQALHQSIDQWLTANPMANNPPDASKQPLIEQTPMADALKGSEQDLKNLQRTLLLLAGFGGLFVALMIGAGIGLYFYLRKKQFDVFEALYRRLRKSDEGAEASKQLEEILKRHEAKARDRKTRVGGIEIIYEGLFNDVKQFWAEWLLNSNDKRDLIAAKQQIADYLELPGKSDKAISEDIIYLIRKVDESLAALLGSDQSNLNVIQTEPAKPLQPRLGEVSNQVDVMWRLYREQVGVQTGTDAGSSAGGTEASGEAAAHATLTQIEKTWMEMLEVYQLFRSIGRPEHTLDFAKESAELLRFYQKKFEFENIEEGAIQKRIEQELTALQEIRGGLNNLKEDRLNVLQPLDDSPAAILQAVKDKLKKNDEDLMKFDSYQVGVASLSPYFPGEDVFVAAKAQAEEHQQAVSRLAPFFSTHDDKATLAEMSRTAQLQLTSATDNLQKMVGKTDSIDKLVGQLVTKFDEVKLQAAEAQDWKEKYEGRDKEYLDLTALNSANAKLAEGLLKSLNFNYTTIPDDNGSTCRIHVKTLLNQPYARQLRLGLSAALLSWDQAVESLWNKGKVHVLSALQLSHTNQRDGVKDKLKDLLATIEEYPDQELWKKVLHPGFGGTGGGWLHRLFRAEILLQTYFSGDKVFSDFIDIIRQAATSTRRTMRLLEVELVPVTLLDLPPKDVATGYRVYPDLTQLDEVRRKVKERLKLGDGFVIDVMGFPFEGTPDTPKFQGNLVLVTPSQW